MFTVFTDIPLTDRGKSLVRKYHKTNNAQLIFKELVEHATYSTKACVESNDLVSYITSAKLGDNTWKGSTGNFILHWLEQIRQYDELTRPQPAFVTTLKRVMLENVVN